MEVLRGLPRRRRGAFTGPLPEDRAHWPRPQPCPHPALPPTAWPLLILELAQPLPTAFLSCSRLAQLSNWWWLGPWHFLWAQDCTHPQGSVLTLWALSQRPSAQRAPSPHTKQVVTVQRRALFLPTATTRGLVLTVLGGLTGPADCPCHPGSFSLWSGTTNTVRGPHGHPTRAWPL